VRQTPQTGPSTASRDPGGPERSSSATTMAEARTDRFFRHLVFNLRAGVVAITDEGDLAAVNDMGYRP